MALGSVISPPREAFHKLILDYRLLKAFVTVRWNEQKSRLGNAGAPLISQDISVA
jgi:hypothetical protein